MKYIRCTSFPWGNPSSPPPPPVRYCDQDKGCVFIKADSIELNQNYEEEKLSVSNNRLVANICLGKVSRKPILPIEFKIVT